jgi:hypothetical protein
MTGPGPHPTRSAPGGRGAEALEALLEGQWSSVPLEFLARGFLAPEPGKQRLAPRRPGPLDAKRSETVPPDPTLPGPAPEGTLPLRLAVPPVSISFDQWVLGHYPSPLGSTRLGAGR